MEPDQPALAPHNSPADSDHSASTQESSSNDADRLMMEQFLDQSADTFRIPRPGEALTGTVVQTDRDELLVDIGMKSEGVVPAREMSSLSHEEREAINIGDQLLLVVVQSEDQEGRAVLSLDKARLERSWVWLQEQHKAQQIIDAPVVGYNKGGVLVNLGGVRGFVPSSQLSSLNRIPEDRRQAELARMVGQQLPLKIIELNRERNRLILSERQATQEQREQRKGQILSNLHEGEIRRGVVTSLSDFGAFVDIGGADGLIHLSELSWNRVKHPSEVLKPGDEVDVYILGVDESRKRIALSLKRTQAEPWSTVNERYQLGQTVKATVTQITSFGAFARIEEGVEGLIHISELSDEHTANPRDVVKEGDVIEARVIRIDAARKRIGLSLRSTGGQPSETAES